MGIGSSNQLSLFKMKQIYIGSISKEKVEFLQGDHMTATTTFYFAEDIKYKCFEILIKLNALHNGLDYVNIYFNDSIIYVIGEGEDRDEYHFSDKVMKNNNQYHLEI